MHNFMFLLLTCSASMSALVLLYMVLSPLLAKRYSEKGRYYAWLIIVIGLIIPFRPSFDNAIIKVDVPSEPLNPIIQIGNKEPVTALVNNTIHSPARFHISIWQIAFAVWFIGMVVFLAYYLLKHYQFTKMAARWSEDITDVKTLELFQSLKSEMNISDHIGLYQSLSIGSPMMTGFVHPRILLPNTEFEPDELRFILQHELIHYKRKDLYYKFLVLIANVAHWFNPIIHLMTKAIDEQCELSCDDRVIRDLDADTRLRYSETIIGVVKYKSNMKTKLSTNFYGGKKGMKKRIYSIMDMSKKKLGISIVCGALIITFGTGFAFASRANTAISEETTIISEQDITSAATAETEDPEALESYARSFDKYKEYGLTYDEKTEKLYYNNEQVRYFEDYFPVDTNSYAGTDYIDEKGTIDIHGVRDLTNIIRNADGSFDPSGKLIGVEPYSPAEFDARDMKELLNPSMSEAVSEQAETKSNDSINYDSKNTEQLDITIAESAVDMN